MMILYKRYGKCYLANMAWKVSLRARDTLGKQKPDAYLARNQSLSHSNAYTYIKRIHL